MHLSPALTSALASRLYKSICSTLRIRERGRDAVDAVHARGERMIFCLWHDELFSLIPAARHFRVVAMVSPSKDGDSLERILQDNNIEAVRGSSTRGGVRALLGLARQMKNEQVHACITLDGPAGPYHKAKEGAIFLANRTDARIVPVRIHVSPVFRAPTWDRFQVPLPFAKATICFGEPWEPGTLAVPDIGEDSVERAKERLERELHELKNHFPGAKA